MAVQPTAPASPDRPGLRPVSSAVLLAPALVHLFGGSEGPPPAWGTDAFIQAVASARGTLRDAGSLADLDPMTPLARGSFAAVVSALATDPGLVAITLRRLEVARGQVLPPWQELLRSGRFTGAVPAGWSG